MFTTTQDLFKATTDYFSLIPKTPSEVNDLLDKTKRVVEKELQKTKDVSIVYAKATKGDASINEITEANKKATELLVTARFVALMALPGALFALPVLSTISEDYGIELIPSSVREEFDI